jgi:hypothetical protein
VYRSCQLHKYSYTLPVAVLPAVASVVVLPVEASAAASVVLSAAASAVVSVALSAAASAEV